MGIQDRDYMRERPHKQERQRGSTNNAKEPLPPWTPYLIIPIAVVVLVALSEHNRPRPMVVTPAQASGTSEFVRTDPALEIPAQEQIANDAVTQDFPPSGTMQWLIQYDPNLAQGEVYILDLSNDSTNKVVRIRDQTGQPVAQLYIRSGEGARFNLPYGIYPSTLGMGQAWNGPEIHFGSTGTYFDFGTIESMRGTMTKQILPPLSQGKQMAPVAGTNF